MWTDLYEQKTSWNRDKTRQNLTYVHHNIETQGQVRAQTKDIHLYTCCFLSLGMQKEWCKQPVNSRQDRSIKTGNLQMKATLKRHIYIHQFYLSWPLMSKNMSQKVCTHLWLLLVALWHQQSLLLSEGEGLYCSTSRTRLCFMFLVFIGKTSHETVRLSQPFAFCGTQALSPLVPPKDITCQNELQIESPGVLSL